MSKGADPDVLALFQQESAARLGALDELLLRLEDEGADPRQVASLFREAHALKGAALVVGLEEIGAAAHVLEELLAGVRSGVLEITADLLDDLHSKLDQLSELAGASDVGPNSERETTVDLRVLPVGAMTTGLQRTARDAAHRTGKVVRCDVRGEDTELDHCVHKQLADALMHLVRNAVDHGIERPEVRRAAGKREEGLVIVHAMQHGSRVIVTVTDDGAGIDVAAVKLRSAELGIDTTTMPRDDVHQLLFRPGFSTAPEVTLVSGRGVGLDAVREGLALLRGHIEVTSTPGAGTRFHISVPIPLTLLPPTAQEVRT